MAGYALIATAITPVGTATGDAITYVLNLRAARTWRHPLPARLIVPKKAYDEKAADAKAGGTSTSPSAPPTPPPGKPSPPRLNASRWPSSPAASPRPSYARRGLVRFRRKNKRDSTGHALAEAREEARASAGQAHADLAEQRASAPRKKPRSSAPCADLREANHFAQIVEAAFRGER